MTPPPQPLSFDALAGFADDDALAAFDAFRDWARAAVAGAPPLRAGRAAFAAADASRGARGARDDRRRRAGGAQLLRRAFSGPGGFVSDAHDGAGFLTGYYEPRLGPR